MEAGCEMKRKERKWLYIGKGAQMKGFWPINGLKWLVQKKGKLMAGVGNEGFAADGR